LRRKRKLPELDESEIDEDVDVDVNEDDDKDDVRSDVVKLVEESVVQPVLVETNKINSPVVYQKSVNEVDRLRLNLNWLKSKN
jgi:hypothetical protein